MPLQFDETASQEPQRPPLAPLGRIALRERDNVPLQLLLELVRDSGPGSGVEGGLEALFDKPLPHPFHSSRADVQRLHNLLVGTPETLRAGIGHKQNASVVQSAGRCLPDRNQPS